MFETAFRRNPVAMAIRRIRDDAFVEVNPSYEVLTGYTREELLGQSVSEFGLYTDPEERRAVRERTDRGELILDHERDLRTKSGAVKRVLMSVDPITLQGERCALASFVDVTEQRRAEQVITHSERRLRRILDGMSAFVGVVSPDGTLLEANHAALGNARVRPEEVLGRAVWEAPVFASLPAMRERLREMVRSASAGQVIRRELDLDIGGTVRTLDTTISPIGDVEGHVSELLAFGVDVTDRNEAQEALRRGEARLREAVEVANIGIFDHDHVTNALYTSRELNENYGLPTDERVDLTRFLEILHPDDREATAAAVSRAHDPSGDGRFDVEYRVVRPDGDVRSFATTSQTYFEGEGAARRAARTVGAVQDITERVLAEQEILEKREHDRVLFEHANAGVSEAESATGKIVRVNARFAEMLGYTVDEAQQLTLYDIIDPEHHEEAADQRTPLIRGETDSYIAERRLLRKDGSNIWVNVSVAALPRQQGLPAREVAFAVDASARREAELALREANQRLMNIVDGAMDGIVTIDRDQRITVFSRTAEVMFGWRADQVIGQPIGFLVPERYRAAHRAHVERYAESGESARPMGHSLRLSGLRADGTEFPIEAVISRNVMADKVALTVFVRDVTERERSNEMRQRLERQLEEAKRMEAVGTLASGIAHDFNNILGAILGNAELALQGERLEANVRERLEDMVSAGRRGAQVVEQILAFSRDAGEARPAIAMRPVVQEVVRLTQSGLPPDVELTVSCDADVPAVLMSEPELHQVVMNLCTNALHAIGDRKGSVTVSLQRAELSDHAPEIHADLRSGLYALLSVSDTGAGMEAAVRERIFEPFFTTRGVGEGTGLGLSVVHGIVRACGGAIMVHSRPGDGSTFHLYLPATREPAGPAAPASSELGPKAAVAARILFVDDEGLLVSVGERLLGRLGYRVTGLTDPVDALVTLRADPQAFDLVLVDFRMPALSGLDLAREIRQLRPELPVVLMSGYVTDELQVKATRLGVCHVLSKPAPAREIARVVAMLTGAPANGGAASS